MSKDDKIMAAAISLMIVGSVLALIPVVYGIIVG